MLLGTLPTKNLDNLIKLFQIVKFNPLQLVHFLTLGSKLQLSKCIPVAHMLQTFFYPFTCTYPVDTMQTESKDKQTIYNQQLQFLSFNLTMSSKGYQGYTLHQKKL